MAARSGPSTISARCANWRGKRRRRTARPVHVRRRHPHAVGHLHRHAAERRCGGGRKSAGRSHHRLLSEVAAEGEIKLEIYDSAGRLVRAYASSGPASLPYKVNVPDFWLAPAPLLPKKPGSIASCGTCAIPIRSSSVHLLRHTRKLFRIHVGRPRHSAQYAVARAAGSHGAAGAI